MQSKWALTVVRQNGAIAPFRGLLNPGPVPQQRSGAGARRQAEACYRKWNLTGARPGLGVAVAGGGQDGGINKRTWGRASCTLK
jgi:hypothetical protein